MYTFYLYEDTNNVCYQGSIENNLLFLSLTSVRMRTSDPTKPHLGGSHLITFG